MIPLPRRQILLPPGWIRQAARLLRRGEWIQGSEVSAFEASFARAVEARYAVGVASARVGLGLAVQSCGLKPGEEILCCAYNFRPFVEILRQVGFTPVFVDADPDTFTIDPEQIERRSSPRTRAILATHLFGQPCDLDSILKIAKRRGWILLEDCAHALGALCEGRRVGAFGLAGLFSFGPGKNLPCFGGGMVTTHDGKLHQRLLERVEQGGHPSLPWLIREVVKTAGLAFGTSPLGFRCVGYPILRWSEGLFPGRVDRWMEDPAAGRGRRSQPVATRLTNLQAAMGLAQLADLEERNKRTLQNARHLMRELADLPELRFQRTLPGTQSTGLYCRALIEEREGLRRALLRSGVDTKRDDMANCGGENYPVAARLARQSLELPNGPSVTPLELDGVARAIRRALRQRHSARRTENPLSPIPSGTLHGA